MGRYASEEEVRELQDLLSRHPEYHLFQQIIQSLESEHLHKEMDTAEEELVEESWSLLVHEMGKGRTPHGHERGTKERGGHRSLKKWLQAAAILTGVVLVSGVAYYGWKHLQQQSRESGVAAAEKRVSVPYGAPREMTLPDSSVVWLNAGSHIRYAGDFAQNKREVYLDGEAYFQVKQDAGHPFLVRAGNITIKVLGTEFNVRAYQDENRIETTLINGKVQVQIAGRPDKKIVLTRDEKLTVINQRFSLSDHHTAERKELSFQVKEVAPSPAIVPIAEVAWLQDKLAFHNEPFAELSKRLERRYDVHIIFSDTALKEERLSGIFENETIQRALKILQMTTPFVYKIQGDTVYLKYRNNGFNN